MSSASNTPRDKSAVRFEIAPRSIALVLATIAGVWLAYQLWVVALILVIALALAGTFNPLIEWMERRGLRRMYALTVLFIALTVAFLSLALFAAVVDVIPIIGGLLVVIPAVVSAIVVSVPVAVGGGIACCTMMRTCAPHSR